MPAAAHRQAAAVLLLGSALALSPPFAPSARAAAWLRAPGEIYAKASFFRLLGTAEFDAEGNARPLFDPASYERGRYLETGCAFYAEYGLGPDVTIVADALVKIADVDAAGRGGAGDVRGVAFGVPDVRLGARLPLARGRVVAAIEPSVSVPVEGVARERVDDPRIGTGTTAFAGALSIGTGLPAVRGYAQAGGGYRARTGKPPAEWFWDLEAGASPFGRLGLRVRYDGVDARTERLSDEAGMTLAAEAGGQDAHRIAPAIALSFGRGGELSITWRRTLSGRSALRGGEWEIGYSILGVIRPAPPPPARPPD